MKTDKIDSRTIAYMIMSDVNLKSYSDTSYHNEELKSLTHYRFDSEVSKGRYDKSYHHHFKTWLLIFSLSLTSDEDEKNPPNKDFMQGFNLYKKTA